VYVVTADVYVGRAAERGYGACMEQGSITRPETRGLRAQFHVPFHRQSNLNRVSSCAWAVVLEDWTRPYSHHWSGAGDYDYYPRAFFDGDVV
jgi:hypothetical protein